MTSLVKRLHRAFHEVEAHHLNGRVPIKELSQRVSFIMNMEQIDFENTVQTNYNSHSISWQELLQVMQGRIVNQVSMLNQGLGPSVEFEVEWQDQLVFAPILAHIKGRQTNFIGQIYRLGSLGESLELLAFLLDKQLLLYQLKTRNILNIFTFCYSGMIEKMLQKASRHSYTQSVDNNFLIRTSSRGRALTQAAEIRETSKSLNRKKVVAVAAQGTSLSKTTAGQIEVQKKTEIRKQRPPVVDIANTKEQSVTELRGSSKGRPIHVLQRNRRILKKDHHKLFKAFETSNLEGSLAIAASFATAGPDDYVEFQEGAEKQKNKVSSPQNPLEKQEHIKRIVNSMRDTAMRLNKRQPLLKNIPVLPTNTIKKDQPGVTDPLEGRKLDVAAFSFLENHLAVSLFNREVRLYSLKRGLHRYSQQLVFERSYEYLPIHMLLYRSVQKNSCSLVLCCTCPASIIVYICYLDDAMKPTQQMALCQLNYVPLFSNIMPLGIACFSESGYFSIIELNYPSCTQSEQLTLNKCFFSQSLGRRISFRKCVMARNCINLYLSCSAGRIHVLQRHQESILRSNAVCKQPISMINLVEEDSLLLVLSSKGHCWFFRTINLELACQIETYALLPTDASYLEIRPLNYIVYDKKRIIGLKVTRINKSQIKQNRIGLN